MQMDVDVAIEKVRKLSDDELLEGLIGVVGASRRAVALVLAHLAEVEERRLHLLAGYASLFAYCNVRLGMSEDEAYRRVRVAGLARRFPSVLERLASGEVSLSVAALLEPHLTEANHGTLLAAVCGKTVAQAREVLATWFPRPDVLPFIRKLPQRAAATAAGAPTTAPACDAKAGGALPRDTVEAPGSAALAGTSASPPMDRTHAARPAPAPAPAAPRPRGASSSIEPLSPERYKIAFTGDAELKRKLELARDLLRHALPQGDLAAIVDRALDVLIERTLQRRFAKTTRPRPPRSGTDGPSPSPAARRPEPSLVPSTSAQAAPAAPPNDDASTPLPSCRSRRLPNAVRRALLERDGLRCTWQGPDGTRCESRAWLEHDHIIPRGQGGTDEPTNIRNFCRAHNQLAAEQAYGQHAMARIIARRRARQRPPSTFHANPR